MVNNIARFFTIFVTALFLAAPIVAADFADENFSVKIDIDTRHPTLGEDLDFTITLENLHNDLDFNKLDITLWLSDEAGKRVGEKLTEDLSKLSQDSEITFDFTWNIPADIDSGAYTLNAEVEGEWQDAQETTTYTATSDVKIRLDIFDLGISNEIQLTSDLLDGRDITQYLTLDIPTNAKAGEHELRVKAYNGNTEDAVTKQIIVESVIAEDLSKDVVKLDEILTPVN